MVAQRVGIADIPVEVLIDNLLPLCGVKDVYSLGCTNKFFALVTADDLFWKRRLAVDYNFTGSETARTSGWKFIYHRLRKPRVFVWGYVMSSFLPSCCEAAHDSPVGVLTRSCSAMITQREGQEPSWTALLSEDGPWRRSFSGRASPSRRPRGQSGSEWNVSKGSVIRLEKTPSYLIVPGYQQGVSRA